MINTFTPTNGSNTSKIDTIADMTSTTHDKTCTIKDKTHTFTDKICTNTNKRHTFIGMIRANPKKTSANENKRLKTCDKFSPPHAPLRSQAHLQAHTGTPSNPRLTKEPACPTHTITP